MLFRPLKLKYSLRRWSERIFYILKYMPFPRFVSYMKYYNIFDLRHYRSIYKNSTFCILPWIHMYIDPLGETFPCCVRVPSMKSFGNINKTPLEEIWNSPSMKNLRLDMLNNRPRSEICGTCYKREKTERTSHRLDFNRKFFHLIRKKLESTEPDGFIKDLSWSYWDFRLSNKCNFRCRTCGPEYSTSWQAELNSPTNPVREANRPAWLTGFEYFLKNSKNIEEIYFAGGEPLLIDEHYKLLEWLIENKKTNTVLSYNTNISVLEYKNWKVLELWKQFKFVYVSPSLDHFGKQAEVIRKGTDWNQVEENLKIILKQKNIQVRPTITVSALNILDFVKIHKYFTQMGLIKTVNHFALNMLLQPDFFSVSVLPQYQKELVQRDLLAYNQELIDRFGEGLSGLNLILNELKIDNSHLQEKLVYELKKVDDLRNEKLHQYFTNGFMHV